MTSQFYSLPIDVSIPKRSWGVRLRIIDCHVRPFGAGEWLQMRRRRKEDADAALQTYNVDLALVRVKLKVGDYVYKTLPIAACTFYNPWHSWRCNSWGVVIVRLSRRTLESARANERRRARVVAVWPGEDRPPRCISFSLMPRAGVNGRESERGKADASDHVGAPRRLRRRAQSTFPGCRAIIGGRSWICRSSAIHMSFYNIPRCMYIYKQLISINSEWTFQLRKRIFIPHTNKIVFSSPGDVWCAIFSLK